jgi:hypothetical protein
MTKGQEILLGALFFVVGLGFVLWLGTRESNRWQALQNRAEQAETRLKSHENGVPLSSYTEVPVMQSVCVREHESGLYCERYMLFKLTPRD